MNEVQYPPAKQNKHQCALCTRTLPAIPFMGIGWRDAFLNPPSKQRSRICNECYVEWRKTHPVLPRELNLNRINNIISLLYIVLAVYGLISFMQYGVANWMGFLSGTGLYLIVAFIFVHLFYGLINKKIEFVQPEKAEKKKYDFNFPNISSQPSPFHRKSEIPDTLNYVKCDVCHEEKLADDLFTHPDGFKICSKCIGRKREE